MMKNLREVRERVIEILWRPEMLGSINA